MVVALYEPASPRFEANTMSARLVTGRAAVSGCCMADSVAARLASIVSMPRAYGRADTARPCARRSFAAATISMAFVICCVFLTLLMRRLMSRIVAMRLPRPAGRAGLSLELRLELGDRRRELRLRRVRQIAILLDRRRHVRVARVDEGEEVLLELLHGL